MLVQFNSCWVQLLVCFCGMDLIIRELTAHVEFEPTQQLLAFYNERESCAAPLWCMLDGLRVRVLLRPTPNQPDFCVLSGFVSAVFIHVFMGTFLRPAANILQVLLSIRRAGLFAHGRCFCLPRSVFTWAALARLCVWRSNDRERFSRTFVCVRGPNVQTQNRSLAMCNRLKSNLFLSNFCKAELQQVAHYWLRKVSFFRLVGLAAALSTIEKTHHFFPTLPNRLQNCAWFKFYLKALATLNFDSFLVMPQTAPVMIFPSRCLHRTMAARHLSTVFMTLKNSIA